MPRTKTIKVAAGIVASFIVLTGATVLLAFTQIVSVSVAKLMFVAMVAMYVGFGTLIAVYRLIDKLK